MYAVIETGGKQYRVKEGDVVTIEKLPNKEGDAVTFTPVLLVVDGDNVKVGQPGVSAAKVVAKVAGQGLGKKVLVQKFKRKIRYRRLIGHRQPFTKVRIEKITG